MTSTPTDPRPDVEHQDSEHPAAEISRADDVLALVEANLAETTSQLESERQAIADLTQAIESAEDDDVTPDAIPARRRVVEHLESVLRGLTKRRARARVDARLARLRALRADLEEIADTDGAEIVVLAQRAQDAAARLAIATEARNRKVREGRARLDELGVPLHQTPAPTPSPAHAELGWDRSCSALAIGRVRVRSVATEHLLAAIATNAFRTANGLTPHPLTDLRAHETADLPADGRYFLNRSGGVEVLPEGPLPHQREHLDGEISAAEAVRIWHRQADESGAGR